MPIATPAAAADWLPESLDKLTGYPVRTQPRRPGEPPAEPLGDALLCAPLTFNTLNAWASGINDTLALGLLNESLGRSVPVAALPWINGALTSHPAYHRNVELLTGAGVLFGEAQDVEPTDIDAITTAALNLLPPLSPEGYQLRRQ